MFLYKGKYKNYPACYVKLCSYIRFLNKIFITMIDFQNSPIFKLSKVDNGSVFDSVKDLLIEGESIIGAYKAIRDFVVFTEINGEISFTNPKI